nr:hypothetical protein [Tanacetum cinerariifolium]
MSINSARARSGLPLQKWTLEVDSLFLISFWKCSKMMENEDDPVNKQQIIDAWAFEERHLKNGSKVKALTDRQIVRLYKHCRMHTLSQGKKIGSCVHIEEPKEKRGMDFGKEARGVKHDGERVVPGSTVPVLDSEELAIKGLKEIGASTWEMEWKEIMIST